MIGNNVIDKSNKDLLQADVFDKKENNNDVLSQETEDAINNKVEKSYQGFLDHVWDGDNDDLSKDFNIWLDKNVDRVLESSKIEEIKKINNDIDENLNKLDFEVNLSSLQKEITRQKDKTENTEIVKLGNDDVKVHLYSGLGKGEVVSILTNTNYKNKSKILNFLKEGKIKEIQKILLENDPDSLPVHHDDEKFGQETLDALKDYIKNNPSYEEIVNDDPASVVYGDEQGSGVNENNITTVTTTNGNVNGYVIGGTSGSDIVTNNTEIVSTVIKFESKYDDLKIGEYVELDVNKKLDSGVVIETIPTGNESGFKIDKNGKLLYKADSKEETFRVKLSKGNVVLSNSVVTMLAEVDKNQVNVDQTSIDDSFISIMHGIKKNNSSYEKIKNAIVAEISKNRKRYVKLDNELKKLGVTPEDTDRKKQIKKIKNNIKQIVHGLLVEEARYELINYLNKNHDALSRKLNDVCEYYIGGEYITKIEFMKQLKNGKIKMKDTQLIGLDVKWDAENETYFGDINQVNKDFVIKSLIITDDPNFMKSKKLTKNEQIQYKAEGYVNLEIRGKENFNSERRALKHILGIKGLFGLGGVDDNMSIATDDYETDNPVLKERRQLKKLKRILMRLMRDSNLDIKGAFKKVNEAYEKGHNVDLGDKYLKKLLDMYTIYRYNADGMIAGGDYFQKAMGLLDNYFIKGIEDFNDTDSVLDIYSNGHIGRFKGLIDPDKQKKAVRQIFSEGFFDADSDFPSFESSQNLRQLKRIVKHIDLNDFFNGGRTYGGKYEKFAALYSMYKQKEKDGKIDKNGNVALMDTDTQGAEYYNAVFDFLVGVGEGKQNIVESVNSMKVLGDSFDVSLEGDNETIRYTSLEEKQFVMALADLNSDGRNDFGDRGMRTGLEIKNIWKSVAVDAKFVGLETQDGIQNTVYGNFVEFAKYYLEKTGQSTLLTDLNNIGSISDMVEEVKINPGLLNSLQNILVNSSIPMDYILKYGKDASEKYLESDKADILSKVLSGKVAIDGLEQKLDAEIQNLVRQGLDVDKIPELRIVLKPMFYGAVINNGGINYAGVGAGLTLNTAKIGSFSLNLGVANVPGSGSAYGVTMSLAKSFDMGSSGNTTLDTRTSAGTTMLFVPIVSEYLGVSTVLNKNKLKHSLESGFIKRISVGANVTILAGLPSRGLSAGYSQEKIEGINIQYNNIKNKLSKSNGIIANVLSGVDMNSDRGDVISELEINLSKNLIGKNLNDLNKSDRLLVAKAANNMFKGLSYYDLNGVLDKNDPKLTTIVHDMAENYALQWKNEAMGDASDVYLESMGVGVQFLAGYYPIPMVTASVAWNKNMYSVESNESVARYYSQLSTGVGMTNILGKKGVEFVDDGGNMTENAVKYLNAKMSIAHPDVDVSDLDITISDYVMSNTNGTLSNGAGKALRIPKSLYKYVNINISSDILSNIHTYVGNGEFGEEGVEYIEVPLNTKIALMDYSRTNAGRFNLIIGDIKTEMDDIKVGPDMDLDNLKGDPTAFENKYIRYMNKDEINNKLPELGSIDLVGQGVTTTVEHPLDVCDSIENGMAIFNLKVGMVGSCIDMGGVNSVLEIDAINNKLILPQFGKLNIYSKLNKQGDRIYEMYYSSTPNDKLDISFDVEGYRKSSTEWVSGTVETIDGEGWTPYETDFSSIDVFDKFDDLDELFEDIEDELSKMDDNNGEYATFMKAVFDAGTGDVLDYTDYRKAFDALQKILNGDLLRDAKFDILRNMIASGALSNEGKLMLVDRFKSIFSYHPKLTNGDNDGAELRRLLRIRTHRYETLKGYDGKTLFPLKGKKYREYILNKLTYRDALSKQKEKNLFGMTAFYRHDNTAGKGYSLTQMGSTKVLGGYMKNIDSNDLKATKERFWNNLDKSGPHKDVLIDSLFEKINENFVTRDFIEANLEDLLKGKRIDIKLKNGISKKIELKLDYVFYLLGECANESIGIKLKGVKILDKDGSSGSEGSDGHDNVERWNVEGGNDKISIDSASSNVNGGVYVNTAGSLQQQLRAGKGGVGVGLAGGINNAPPPPPPTNPDPNVPPPPPPTDPS